MVEGTSLLRKHTGLNLYRGFESLALRQVLISLKYFIFLLVKIKTSSIMHAFAPVAQLDRVLGYEPRGQEFESLRAHQTDIEVGTCFR